MPEKIKLTLAYDGSAYVGWQLQPNGISVQECVERALLQLCGERIRVHSSGRTDAGVHARGMVCHFVAARVLPLSAWREGLNRFLPEDIAVREAEKVADDFHARYSAIAKHYRYTLLRDPVRSPLERRTSWRIKSLLDLDRMQQACTVLMGIHDFAAFRGAGCSSAVTQKEIYNITLTEADRLLYVDVYGSGFLRHMVRMIVGTLVEIGRGRRSVATLRMMLSEPDNAPAAITAPPHGLCLIQVEYGTRQQVRQGARENYLDRAE
ncbi:MAG: tRNA pseudouridine(38-40) synthase TruA [Desulfuromonadales bacterium]|nr:tRNA pseudouridine(38-40) synthase TruA [Desulfuromonadales bacterium]